jgi:GT2 family glycosyltransferase
MNAIEYPKASLIIPNLNGKEMLRACLTSLMKLDYPNYEIIVSDGGSTDGAYEMVQKDFGKVKVVREEGAGIGRSINLGIQISEGDIIGFDLNNDEVFKEDWLKRLVEVLVSSSDIGIVGGTRIVKGTKNVVDEGGYISDFLGITKNNSGQSLHRLSKHPKEVDFVGIPVFRKHLIRKIGDCDEEYRVYFEDSDFCMRAKKAGFRVLWVPTAISYHRRHATISKHHERFEDVRIKNKIRFIIKNWKIQSLPFALLYQTTILPILKIIYSKSLYHISFFRSRKIVSMLFVNDAFSYALGVIKALWWNLKYLKSSTRARVPTQYSKFAS